MKGISLLYFLLLYSTQNIQAQTDSSFFEVIKAEDEFHHSIINGHTFLKKGSAGYWDNQLLVKDIHSSPTLINQKIYITQIVNDDVYEILEIETNGNLKSKGKLAVDHIFDTPYDFFCLKNNQLLILNPETLELKVVFDYKALAPKNDSRFSLQSVNAISENELALEFGMYEQGCYDFDTYIVDKRTGKIIYNNQHKGKENWTSISKFCVFLKDEQKKEYYVYRSDGHDKEGHYYIFNEDFSIRRQILGGNETLPFQCTLCEYGTYVSGIRVENDQLKHLYLGVYYYEGNERITYYLPYKFDSHLWHLIDQVFNHKKLYKNDLEKLNFYQLSILKNSVFAKHNYQFDSDFYRAYFSLFDFYANTAAGKTRTKNINALLSENDRNNLSLIFSTLKDLD